MGVKYNVVLLFIELVGYIFRELRREIMKKLTIIVLLIFSTMIFAKGNGGSSGGMGSGMHGDMSQTMDQTMDQLHTQDMDQIMDKLHFQDKLNQEIFMNLSSEQQDECMQMQNQYQNEYQNHINKIAEINKKMNQEMKQEKLSTRQLKRLRKQKIDILEKIEKNRLTHRIRMREKFGIDPEYIE
jgi:hypothetical protein